jgi:hypothetical protein
MTTQTTEAIVHSSGSTREDFVIQLHEAVRSATWGKFEKSRAELHGAFIVLARMEAANV